jgi:AcrR family transcriptional regulator
VRERILDATGALLSTRSFASLAVNDILAEAGVARASFYFYFESKYAVLAELARRAVSGGHDVAQPWLTRETYGDARATLRQGILDGAQLWRAHAPVLRAVVEHWREDPQLALLWVELIDSYTTAAVQRIDADRAAGIASPTPVDSRALAAALSWLSERIYYLAAIDVAPFDDTDAVAEALTHIWTAAIYGSDAPDLAQPCRR